ncbi:MAG: hypothetical protein ACOXZ1_01815 [Patescibacteria group bacterium]|jgi:hypothetical protein|nr:hypothetical protein [Patescibacteria group bacterium]
MNWIEVGVMILVILIIIIVEKINHRDEEKKGDEIEDRFLSIEKKITFLFLALIGFTFLAGMILLAVLADIFLLLGITISPFIFIVYSLVKLAEFNKRFSFFLNLGFILSIIILIIDKNPYYIHSLFILFTIFMVISLFRIMRKNRSQK